MKTLKYYFEYCASTPFWVGADFEFISYDSLAISNYLKKEIKELQDEFQSTYNQVDGRESGFSDIIQEGIWAHRVLFSADILKAELKNKYDVIFKKWYYEYPIQRMNEYLNKKYY